LIGLDLIVDNHLNVSVTFLDVMHFLYISDCPKNFTNTSGTIMSPNYPDFYPKNYNCQWQISIAVGYQIYLTFTYFDLVHTPKCSGDHVAISGVSGGKDGNPERHCGYLVKRYPLVSKMNEMVITFQSDGQDSSRGFVLDYKVDGTGNGVVISHIKRTRV